MYVYMYVYIYIYIYNMSYIYPVVCQGLFTCSNIYRCVHQVFTSAHAHPGRDDLSWKISLYTLGAQYGLPESESGNRP